MKHKNHHKTIHQHIEQAFRHKVSLVIVLFLTFTAAASLDGRVRALMQEAYSQGWGWVGTFIHHEHPMHNSHTLAFARTPTTSGPGPRR